jgi:hypothetical protein
MKSIDRSLFPGTRLVRWGIVSAVLIHAAASSTALASNVTWFAPSAAANGNASIGTSSDPLSGSLSAGNLGVAFTTGSAGPFTMSWLNLTLYGPSDALTAPGSFSFKIALHATSNSTVGSAVAASTAYATDTVTFSAGDLVPGYQTKTLTASQLTNVMGYAMAANTSYALIIYDYEALTYTGGTPGVGRQQGLYTSAAAAAAAYSVTNGFTALNTFRNNTTWSIAAGNFPTLGISFGATASAVPGSGAMAMLGMTLIPGLRRRRR